MLLFVIKGTGKKDNSINFYRIIHLQQLLQFQFYRYFLL